MDLLIEQTKEQTKFEYVNTTESVEYVCIYSLETEEEIAHALELEKARHEIEKQIALKEQVM
jgi:hypothetical protein